MLCLVAGANAMLASSPPSLVRLGTSDLHVSKSCLGGMTWGNQNTKEDACKQLDMAFDFGANFVDTAEGYPVPMSPETAGRTDEYIANWMAVTKTPRDSIVISTKVCGYNDRYTWFRESGEGTQLTRAQIHESVDKSLARLKTDHIDLLQFHWPERSVGLTRGGPDVSELPTAGDVAPAGYTRSRDITPYAQQVEAIGELLTSGKIRSWGLSNENAEGTRAFLAACDELGVARPVAVQNAYSLLQRADEDELIKLLREHEMSYLAYSPLSGGVLSGKYAATRQKRGTPGKKLKQLDSRLWLVAGYEEAFAASDGPLAVEAYCAIAQKHGMTPTQLAIAHCASREWVTSTIVGATSLTQLAEDLMGFRVEWTDACADDVARAYERMPNPWRVQVAGMG